MEKRNLLSANESSREKAEETLNRIIQLMFKRDIQSLLSSPMSYEEKIKILKEKRQKAGELASIIDNELFVFENTDHYLDKMKQSKKKSGWLSLIEAPIGLAGFISMVKSCDAFINAKADLMYHGIKDSNTNLYMGLFIASGLLAAILSSEAYGNVRDYHNYEKEIKSYNKMLKRKTI